GGPNGNGGLRQTGGPRPGGPGRSTGGPARPGQNSGRPGPGGRPGHGGGHGGRPQHTTGGPHRGGPLPTRGPRTATIVKPSGPVAIRAQIVVKDLADLLKVSSNEVIRQLISAGVFANINEVVNYDAAAKVAEAIGYTPEEAAVPAPTPAVAIRPE